MNEKYQQQNDMSHSSIRNIQNLHRGVYDSFDISLDANENRNTNYVNNESKKSVPISQSIHNEFRPTIGVTSPGDSNIPTQGDIHSPKEENSQQAGRDFRIPSQIPNQSQFPRERLDLETEIFSFRREGQRRSEDQERDQRNPENQRDDIELMNYRNSYEMTRLWFLKLKKAYIFFLLNLLCIGLVTFNLFVAYTTEHISFSQIGQIDNQFQQKVILDIDLVAKFQNCNDAYTPALMGNWPGYKQICQCSTFSYPGECHPEDSNEKCENQGNFETFSIQYWDGKKICLRKSEKSILQYYETSNFVESYNGNFMCPNGLKKCIVSSNRNFICVGRFEFCPVTQIEVDYLKNSDKNKFKAQLLFENKILVYDNQGAASTTFIDLIADHQYCNAKDSNLKMSINQNYCHNKTNKTLLDSIQESQIIHDNLKDSSAYTSIEGNDITMDLYVVPTDNLDMCVFNNTFNPVILNSQLTNWKGVKYILFMNPFFITTLLIINLIRVLMIKYLNKEAHEAPSIRRKKEIYNLFGKTFAGSSIIVVTEICIILYYIFWGYLLLNPDKLIAEKWMNMSCLSSQIKAEIEYMINQFTKIETYNMITIGPMILGCILEALFAQYKLITEPYDQLREEREENQ